jgi:hypothetical protein
MQRCILHVGMPKTGTSSIQESLFFGLNDSRFQYFTGGEVNTARALILLGTEGELPGHFHGELGSNSQFLASERQEIHKRLAYSLDEATRNGRDLIVSGENCWRMSETELQQLKSVLESRGAILQVIAYLRPWKAWLESNFAQRAQLACMFGSRSPFPTEMKLSSPVQIDYRNRIETFDRVFGRENVVFRKFDPAQFPDGCVTRDFCQLTGISLSPDQIRRANESLRLSAVRFVCAYGKFANREAASGRWTVWQHHWLMSRLLALPGPGLRFHSSMIEPLLKPLLPHLNQIEERIGSSLREDWAKSDEGECIRTEEDLFRFSADSLDWLESESGARVPRDLPVEESARRVGDIIHRMRHSFPGFQTLSRSALFAAHRAWIRWTRSR